MLGVLAKYIQDVSVLRRLLFAVVFLSPDLPMFWGVVVEFATAGEVSKTCLTPEQAKIIIENLQALNVAAFQTEHALQKELIFLCLPGKKPIGIPLIPSSSVCLLCGNQLQIRKDRHASIVIYDSNYGTIPGAHFHKFCTKRTCSFVQYYGYYSTQSKVIFNDDWSSLPYFISSRDTGFSMEILKELDAHILIAHVSFKQQADIYNYLHKYTQDNPSTLSNDLESRLRMDRRRLEAAYLQYALLRVAACYPADICISKLHLHDGLSETLLKVTPAFHHAFIRRNAEHRCDAPGCGEVMVLDGNMKNSREVCYATHAGHAEFSGLPGSVQSGCPNTPAYKSRYCKLHAPITIAPHQIQFSEDGNPEIPNPITVSEERQVAIITAKRVTRNSTFYQVVWLGRPMTDCTWEPESALPISLVSNYESGVVRDIQRDSFTSGGQTIHTLVTKSIEHGAKRQKMDISEYSLTSTGAFTFPEQESEMKLKCNTEKDAHARLNYRTAGILAGVWPCGRITMMGELFGAESKSQVYGHLHAFFYDNESATASLKTLCYDDGCHLKRYACNSARSAVTTTASRLASLNYAIDRMHFKGHVDPWCRNHCDPNKFIELENVNTEICEQTFSWLSKYSKITRHMNRENFLFYLLYLCELHNGRKA